MQTIAVQSFVAATMLLAAPAAYAVYPAITFDEVAQTADLVFSGTVTAQDYVTSGGAPYTEVVFDGINVLASDPQSRQKKSASVKLTYAGGQLADGFLEVSGTPSFITGQKYLVFMHDDGKNYFNPIVGGSAHGLFKVLTDTRTGKEYVVNLGGKGVVGADDGKLAYTGAPVAEIANGTPQFAKSDRDLTPVIAYSADGRPSEIGGPDARNVTALPVTVDTFADQILLPALNETVEEKRLILDGNQRGKFYREVDGKMETLDLPQKTDAESSSLLSSIPDSRTPVPEEIQLGTASRAQPLSACGTHNKYITMEMVPSGWWEYPIIENCLWIHNQFMDLFRLTASDSTFGNNGVNEFGGYPNSSTLSGIYGSYDWGGSLGVCFTYRASSTACARITQSDVFWNPSYSFSDDVNSWWQSGSTYNFRATTLHEIGHVWGLQTGDPEQYNYDQPSMMHSIYSNIYETGHGLHADDAYIFRRHYDDQLSIPSIRDLGIESYYADEGLNKSTLSATTVARGKTISFNNVTVENMSNTSVSNVRIRFYLSTTRDLTGTNYQVGNDWTFGSLPQEYYTVNNYTDNTVPSSVPPGTYYVIAYVDSTSVTDAYWSNNLTVFTDRVTVTAPSISRSPSSLSRTTAFGTNAGSQSFSVWNGASGGGTMNYNMGISYSSGSGWLSVSPSSGQSTGEYDSITVSYNSSSLPAGLYNATITISSPEATNSAQTIPVALTVQPPPAPSNDNLANATIITGYSGTTAGTNVGATKQTGEPSHAGNSGGASIWFSWTSPATGTATIDTSGSGIVDTVLAVYTGSSFPLTLVMQDDDGYGAGTRHSKVTFPVTNGTNYKIAVDGYNGATGSIMLNRSLSVTSTVADWSMY